jgi:mRNA interferase RelE/StbE
MPKKSGNLLAFSGQGTSLRGGSRPPDKVPGALTRDVNTRLSAAEADPQTKLGAPAAATAAVYELKFLGRALDDLKRIDKPHQRIIKEKLLILAENPEALKNNIKRLAADEDFFRLRVGSYRVIFKKEDRRLLILIVRIGHRKEIYLSLK